MRRCFNFLSIERVTSVRDGEAADVGGGTLYLIDTDTDDVEANVGEDPPNTLRKFTMSAI